MCSVLRAASIHLGVLTAVFLSLCETTTATPANNNENSYWQAGFHRTGVGQQYDASGAVHALLAGESTIFVGGFFDVANTFCAKGIVGWDGNRLFPLNPGADGNDGSLAGSVRAMTMYNGNLIVAGNIESAGGQKTYSIARWNGSAWNTLGGGLYDAYEGNKYRGDVFALCVHDGKLIAAGDFYYAGGKTVTNIAQWDGAAWNPVGPAGFFGANDIIRAVISFGGELYAGGSFTYIGGQSISYIARWNGTQWQPVGSGLNRFVYSMTVKDNQLVVGGTFTAAGGILARRVATWNGAVWQPLGDGLNDRVTALGIYKGELLAGGWFTKSGLETINGVARWDGSGWRPVHPQQFTGRVEVNSIVEWQGDLYLGGAFYDVGDIVADKIVRWDGSAWRQLGDPGLGVETSAESFTIHRGAMVAASGVLRHAGQERVNSVALWDGNAWHPMGDGVFQASNVASDGDRLFAAGSSSALRVNIYEWDESRWRSLGWNMQGSVYAMEVWRGDLVVGGFFKEVRGVTVNNIVLWDGADVATLDGGVDYTVHDLTTFEGDLIACGSFNKAGGVTAYHIARWDGQTWKAFDDPLGYVSGFAVAAVPFRNGLAVAGLFSLYGDAPGDRIALWNGSDWVPLGVPWEHEVDVLAVHGGELYAAGGGQIYDGSTGPTIARWDGQTWRSLGSPPSGGIYALQSFRSDLFVGGRFSIAGNRPSIGIARWNGPPLGRKSPTVMDQVERTGGVRGVKLLEAVPNPFNPSTVIGFELPASAQVSLRIFDVGGRHVATVADRMFPAGTHRLTWNGRSATGESVASGVYFCRLQAGTSVLTSRLVLLK